MTVTMDKVNPIHTKPIYYLPFGGRAKDKEAISQGNDTAKAI